MDNIKLDKEFQGLIPPLSSEEFIGLEDSIQKEGCRDSLIVWNDILVDGHNRKLICDKYKLPYKTKESEFKDRNEVILWIIDNQLSRRNITPFARIELEWKKAEILKPIAEENMKRGTLVSNDTKVDMKKEVANKSRVGSATASKVKKILDQAPEEIKQKLREGSPNININKAYQDIRREEKKEEIKLNPVEIPKGKFNVIYTDPPWKYKHSKTKSREIENQYPTMDLEDIKKMEIPADENSVLFLWSTAPKLKEALEVMESWGFEYKTCAVWDKQTIGMGYWFRNQHELLLVGVKGKMSPPFEENRITSVYSEKKSRHSKKPERYYKFIEKMCPNSKYLELFSRQKRKNWASWGNQ